MLTVRCWRRPDGVIPWVEVNRGEYHRNFVTQSTVHERISLIQHQILIARQDWSDIIVYDTETSRYTTVADRECLPSA